MAGRRSLHRVSMRFRNSDNQRIRQGGARMNSDSCCCERIFADCTELFNYFNTEVLQVSVTLAGFSGDACDDPPCFGQSPDPEPCSQFNGTYVLSKITGAVGSVTYRLTLDNETICGFLSAGRFITFIFSCTASDKLWCQYRFGSNACAPLTGATHRERSLPPFPLTYEDLLAFLVIPISTAPITNCDTWPTSADVTPL